MKRYPLIIDRIRARQARREAAGWALLCLLAAAALGAVLYSTAMAQTIEAPRLEARR